MPSNDPARRIAELCAEILAANEAYATEAPLMLDAEYDELYRRARRPARRLTRT